MALSTQTQQIALRKASQFIRAKANGAMDLLWKGFTMGLNQENITGDLEFKAFGDLTGDSVIANVACKVYAIYLKKQATGTDAYFKAVNHATVAAGTTFEICVGLPGSGDEVLLCFPKGIAFGTGVTLVSSTTDVGGSDTSTGDGPDGFFVIGAA